MSSPRVDLSESRPLNRSRLAELVLESAGDFAIFTTDLGGIITSWNSAAERIIGWPAGEAIGQDACMIFTPEDRASGACAQEMERARRDGRSLDERWHLRRDGSRFWATGTMTRLEDDETAEHVGYTKIVRDGTAQHEADERTRASEALLRNVFENSPDCLKLLTPDGRVTAMNRSAVRLLEIDSAEAVTDRPWALIWPEEERGKVEAALAEATAGRVGRFHGCCPTAKGVAKWWDVQVTSVPGRQGGVELLVASCRDTTEQERAREALRLSEERLRAALAIRTVGVLFWQVGSGLAEVNDAYLRMSGFSRDEVIGRRWHELTPPEFHELSRQAIAEVHALGEARPLEKQYCRKDGSRWWGLFAARRLKDEVVEFVVDITDRKAAEREVRDLNEHLEMEVSRRTEQLRQHEDALRQSQKLEAVGQLTGGVAHDFNNLLTIIRSSADLLRRPHLPEERRQSYVEAIADTANRAARLTGQLLAFARRQPLQPEVFEVGARVEDVTDLIRPLVGARIAIATAIECGGCAVEADPSQFETALVNLAVNARDAMDGEGRLTLRTWLTKEVPPTRSHAGTRGEFVAVSVSDTGAGISPELLGRIFEPFFTTKEVGKGTGLGLSQAYGFAKQSGGELLVESAPGRGATFTLYLPRAEPRPAVEPARGGGEAGGSEAERRHVLLVEDNTQVGEFARQLLEDMGYAPTWAPGASVALQILERSPERFAVVFSDVVMPGMNGVELASEIRRRWPGLRIVLTSGYSHVLASDGTHGFELLRKPYSVEALSKALRPDR